MAPIEEADAVVLGVLLAFAVAGVCLMPWSIGDIAALFKRAPLVRRPPTDREDLQ